MVSSLDFLFSFRILDLQAKKLAQWKCQFHRPKQAPQATLSQKDQESSAFVKPLGSAKHHKTKSGTIHTHANKG